VELFLKHDWPGNVRQLRNAIQRTLALGIVDLEAPAGGPKPGTGVGSADYRESREEALRQFEISYLNGLMARHGGNLSAAAREAGVDRKHIRELLKKHGLHLKDP
jgi:DNA-binding NtrC family response regulator